MAKKKSDKKKNHIALQPFGYKTGWLAFQTEDVESVAKSIGVKLVDTTDWNTGIDRMYEESYAFLSLPINGWILLADRGLISTIDSPEIAADVAERVRDLSHVLKTKVQLFATHRVIEGNSFIYADNGTIIRAFCFLGESGEIQLEIGKPTDAEAHIEAEEDGFIFVGEDDVMKVAAGWSIDPQTLSEILASDACGYLIPNLDVPELSC